MAGLTKPEGLVLTKSQQEALRRHKLTQHSWSISYEIRCSCGWRSQRFQLQSVPEAWKATQAILRHASQIWRDLGITEVSALIRYS